MNSLNAFTVKRSLCRVSHVLLMSTLVACSTPPPTPPFNNTVICVRIQAMFLTMALTADLGLVPRHSTGAANGPPGLQVRWQDIPSYMCPHEHTNMQLLFQIQMSCDVCISSDRFNFCLSWESKLYTKHTYTLFSVRIHHFYGRKI